MGRRKSVRLLLRQRHVEPLRLGDKKNQGASAEIIRRLKPKFTPATIQDRAPPAYSIISDMRFIAELDIQIRAKAALILIRTPEEARVQGEILSFAANTGRELISWDICAGFTPLRGKNAPDGGRDPLAALEAIDKAAPDRAARRQIGRASCRERV